MNIVEERKKYDEIHRQEKARILSEYQNISDSPFGRVLEPITKKPEKCILYFPDFETCHKRFTKARKINKYKELTKRL